MAVDLDREFVEQKLVFTVVVEKGTLNLTKVLDEIADLGKEHVRKRGKKCDFSFLSEVDDGLNMKADILVYQRPGAAKFFGITSLFIELASANRDDLTERGRQFAMEHVYFCLTIDDCTTQNY